MEIQVGQREPGKEVWRLVLETLCQEQRYVRVTVLVSLESGDWTEKTAKTAVREVESKFTSGYGTRRGCGTLKDRQHFWQHSWRNQIWESARHAWWTSHGSHTPVGKAGRMASNHRRKGIWSFNPILQFSFVFVGGGLWMPGCRFTHCSVGIEKTMSLLKSWGWASFLS